jgi:hypothetical protein
MFNLFQTTPRYVGAGQPASACSGGVLSVITGFMGGLFPGAPRYKTAPAEEPATAPVAAAEAEPDLEPEPEVLHEMVEASSPNGTPIRVPTPVTIVIQRGQRE